MTDEEKAERNIKDHYALIYFDKELLKLAISIYLDGLAEGRGEVTYMTAKEYDEYLNVCRENVRLKKETEELKEKIEELEQRNKMVQKICFDSCL